MYKDVPGKLKSLTNTGAMFNATMKKTAATMAYLKNKAIWQFTNSKINFSAKVSKGKSGSMHVMFKTKNAMDYFGIAIAFNESKSSKSL